MKPYCLSKEELSRFIEVELEGGEMFDDEVEFNYLLETWRTWDTEFICLVTVFSQILEQQLKSKRDALSTLKKTFALLENTGCWLTIEGFNENFVAYFLQHYRMDEIPVDEDLSYLRSQLGEFRY